MTAWLTSGTAGGVGNFLTIASSAFQVAGMISSFYQGFRNGEIDTAGDFFNVLFGGGTDAADERINAKLDEILDEIRALRTDLANVEDNLTTQLDAQTQALFEVSLATPMATLQDIEDQLATYDPNAIPGEPNYMTEDVRQQLGVDLSRDASQALYQIIDIGNVILTVRSGYTPDISTILDAVTLITRATTTRLLVAGHFEGNEIPEADISNPLDAAANFLDSTADFIRTNFYPTIEFRFMTASGTTMFDIDNDGREEEVTYFYNYYDAVLVHPLVRENAVVASTHPGLLETVLAETPGAIINQIGDTWIFHGSNYVLDLDTTAVSPDLALPSGYRRFSLDLSNDLLQAEIDNAAASLAIIARDEALQEFQIPDDTTSSYESLADSYRRLTDGEVLDVVDAFGNIQGTNGNDLIRGNSDANLLEGFDDPDILRGRGGNDTLRGGDGTDLLIGGDGDDRLEGGNDRDRLFGNDGNDTLLGETDTTTGTTGGSYFDGGAGDDSLVGDIGRDIMHGGDGNDTIIAGRGEDTIFAGTGFDIVDGGSETLMDYLHPDELHFTGDLADYDIEVFLNGDVVVTGDSTSTETGLAVASEVHSSAIERFVFHDQTVELNYADQFVPGSPSNVTGYTSGPGADIIIGLEIINSYGTIYETSVIYAGAGNDTVVGHDRNDIIYTGDGNDSVFGGDGRDTISGENGDDTLVGGTSETDIRDDIYGGDGNDSIDGGYGNDQLRGDAGNDTIEGGYGVDMIVGGGGNDVLSGSAWSDEMYGSEGDDFINGGYGFDRVNGGAGADRFFHIGVAGHGSDWIQDYTAADGDVLMFGQAGTRDQFQVNFDETASAGLAGVEEAFVIYRPTGQILWALVDGGAQAEINLLMGGVTYDLLA